MHERLKRLNMFVVTLVIIYTVSMHSFFVTIFDSVIVGLLADFLTSLAFYELLLLFLYTSISRNDTLLRLFWGKIYLKGLWSYSYTLDNVQYKGIWRIDQDLFETKVVGYGIDNTGKPRSDVRSVSDLYERRQSYEIINIRKDKVQIQKENFSRTELFPDYKRRRQFFSFDYPTKMRAITTIYGGVLSDKVHTDVYFVKHENARSEEDVVQELIHPQQNQNLA